MCARNEGVTVMHSYRSLASDNDARYRGPVDRRTQSSRYVTLRVCCVVDLTSARVTEKQKGYKYGLALHLMYCTYAWNAVETNAITTKIRV